VASYQTAQLAEYSAGFQEVAREIAERVRVRVGDRVKRKSRGILPRIPALREKQKREGQGTRLRREGEKRQGTRLFSDVPLRESQNQIGVEVPRLRRSEFCSSAFPGLTPWANLWSRLTALGILNQDSACQLLVGPTRHLFLARGRSGWTGKRLIGTSGHRDIL